MHKVTGIIGKHQDGIHIIALLLLAFVLFFHGLGSYSLKEPDEGRYAEIPREMVETGDYVVPHLNYVRYFEKPPLFYWAVAASYKVLGVSACTFRLPNALSALLTVMALYFFARRLFGRETAFLSSVILVSSLGFFAMARVVTLDMFFTLWLFLSLASFYLYYREGRPLFIYLFYLFMALSTLVKGPAGVALTGLTIVIFLLSERRISFLKEMKWVGGIALFLAVLVPWAIAISLKEKEFFYFFVIDQNILRFFTSKHKRTGSVFYFIPVLLGGMLPWSFFIPRAVIHLWRRRDLRLFFIWSAVVFAFFSVSKSKLPPYILPVFPAIALIVGAFFHDQWEKRSGLAEALAYMVLFAVLSSAAFLPAVPAFKAYVASISADAPVVVGDLKGFSILLSVMAVMFIVLLLMRKGRQYRFLFPAFTIFSCVIVVMLISSARTLDRFNTVAGIGAAVNALRPAPAYVVNFAGYDEALPFYTRRRVMIAAYTGELEMGSKYEDAQPWFISEAEFLKLFASDSPIAAVLKEKKLKRLKVMGAGDRMRIVSCQSDRCLVTNY